MNIRPSQHQQWNTNTIVAMAGFSITLVTVIITTTLTFARIQAQVEAWAEFQRRQEMHNAETEAFKKQVTQNQMDGEQVRFEVEEIKKRQMIVIERLGKMDEDTVKNRERMHARLGDIELHAALLKQYLIMVYTKIKTPVTPGLHEK